MRSIHNVPPATSSTSLAPAQATTKSTLELGSASPIPHSPPMSCVTKALIYAYCGIHESLVEDKVKRN